MSLAAGILRPDALREEALGLALEVRLPWYRSLPLSCLEALELSVDGERVPAEDLLVAAGGRDRPLDALGRLDDVTWFVHDPIVVKAPRRVESGDEVEVRVVARVRIPYIQAGPGTPLVQTTERSQRLVVQPARHAAAE